MFSKTICIVTPVSWVFRSLFPSHPPGGHCGLGWIVMPMHSVNICYVLWPHRIFWKVFCLETFLQYEFSLRKVGVEH